MRSIIMFCLMLFAINVNGQESNILIQIDDEIAREHYKNASDLLVDYYEKSSDQSVLGKIGYVFYLHGDTQMAISWFNEAQANGQSLDNEYILPFAEALYSIGDFDKTKAILENYQGENQTGKNRILKSIEDNKSLYVTKDNYKVSTLEVNSSLSDFGIIQYDQGYLMTSNRSFEKKENEELEYNYFDLYYFETKDFTSFSSVQPFDKKFDSRGNDGPIAFFSNESKAIVSRNNYHRGIRGITHRGTNEIELYEIDKNQDGKWGKLSRLPFDDDSYSSFHPTISSDGTSMIFASNRPGGQGGADLYKVEIIDGKWSEPKNLGPNINTAGNELFPTIQGDSMLVFSSNGHVGLGGLDLYSTPLEDPKVENLGAPFNSTADDFSWFYIDEKKQVVSSSRNNEVGNDDLLMIERIKEPELKQTVMIKPKIDVWRVENKKNPVQGVALSEKNQYFLKVEGENTILKSKDNQVILTSGNNQFNQKLASNFSDININTIQPVYFGFAKEQAEQISSIQVIVDFMNRFPAIKIQLIGYTDSKGSAAFNLALSEKRSQFIKDELVEKGIKKERISVQGKGESDPLFQCKDDCSPEQYQNERRVELIFE